MIIKVYSLKKGIFYFVFFSIYFYSLRRIIIYFSFCLKSAEKYLQLQRASPRFEKTQISRLTFAAKLFVSPRFSSSSLSKCPIMTFYFKCKKFNIKLINSNREENFYILLYVQYIKYVFHVCFLSFVQSVGI